MLQRVAENIEINFPAYEVSEVGYKLSKRKERAKPNQLMRLKGNSGEYHSNMHLMDEEFTVEIDEKSPKNVLDHIRKHVAWS